MYKAWYEPDKCILKYDWQGKERDQREDDKDERENRSFTDKLLEKRCFVQRKIEVSAKQSSLPDTMWVQVKEKENNSL